MVNKFGGIVVKNLYKIVFGIVFVSIFFLLYLTNLGSFIKGDTKYESPAFLGINGLEPILQNVSLAPIKFLELIMLKIDEPNSTLLRLVSAFFVFMALVIFYRLILKWQTHRMAMLSTLMYGSSAYVISMGRFTSQDALYFSVVPALLLIGTWLKSKQNVNKMYLALPIIGVLLYVPGFIFFLLALLAIFKKRIKVALKFSSKKSKILGGIAFTIISTPLIYALVIYPSQIVIWLGLDNFKNGSLGSIARELINIPEQLFLTGPNEPYRWLFGTPIIDIVSIVFVALGLYAYIRSTHSLRALILASMLVGGSIIVATSSVVSLALIIPIVYILIAKGLAFMLHNWFAVFPKNPAARTLGVILLIVPVFLSVGYNIEKYFNAWRDAPETISVIGEKS